MRILEVYDAEQDFFVTVITPPAAHEAYATIHLTGGECNAQTCMAAYASHTPILSQPGRSASRPFSFAIKSQTNV